jgi:hypothetical protein
MEFLPWGVRYYHVYNLLLTAFDEGLTATAVLRTIQHTPLGMRASEFYKIAREVREAWEAFQGLRELSPSAVPRRRDLPEWPFSAPPGVRYRARFEITYTDPEGQTRKIYRDLYFGRLHQRREFEAMGEAEVAYAVEELGGTLTEVRLSGLWKIGE